MISPIEIKALAKQILDSGPGGGMDGADVAELAMQLVSILVFKSLPERRDEAIAQLAGGFRAAITEGKARAALREAAVTEAAEATKQ